MSKYNDTDQEVVNEKGGKKNNKNKPRWELLPLDAVEKIVEVITYGAEKYGDNNWKKVFAEEYRGATLRHHKDDACGDDYDKESGFLHLAHEACNVLFRLWLKMHENNVVYSINAEPFLYCYACNNWYTNTCGCSTAGQS